MTSRGKCTPKLKQGEAKTNRCMVTSTQKHLATARAVLMGQKQCSNGKSIVLIWVGQLPSQQ